VLQRIRFRAPAGTLADTSLVRAVGHWRICGRKHRLGRRNKGTPTLYAHRESTALAFSARPLAKDVSSFGRISPTDAGTSLNSFQMAWNYIQLEKCNGSAHAEIDLAAK